MKRRHEWLCGLTALYASASSRLRADEMIA